MQPSKAWIISDTIEKNKRIFKIPVYQRNYDWNNIQCEKLYSDILDAFHTQRKHFTGTIVYIIGERNSSSLTEDLIIDGQQRITTILLLLKALLDFAIQRNDSIKSELSDLLFNRHCAEEYKLKLKPIKADDHQFQSLMRNDEESYDNNSHIIRNYILFKKLIAKSLADGLMLCEILEGMKKLEIVEIVLDKSQGDDPQVIFESINSTGLELSLADKIRNFVLMDDEHQDELFEKYWLPLEERIGSEFLTDYFITFLEYKLPDYISERNAYGKFCKLFKEKDYTHESILNELNCYVKYYAAFIGKKNIYSNEINRVLADFRLLDQTTLYTFLFDIFNDYSSNNISEEILLKVLRFLRNYSLRRVICEQKSNSLRGLYKTLYGRLFKNEATKNAYYETIYRFFKTTNTNDKLVSDSEFRDSLLHKKLYTKKKACKFLLAALENGDSNEQLITDSLTVEHILPQKERALVWVKEIGEDKYDQVYNTYLHTLGNLTITGYNSELGAKPFSQKKEIISKNSKAKNLNETILSEEHWNECAIIHRAEILADKALTLFAIEDIPLEDIPDNISDSDRYTLHDKHSATGTIPSGYTFCGESVVVKSYVGMLTSIVNTLFDLDSSVMERLAKNKYKLNYCERTYITTDPSDLRVAKEIGNSGIFYETNLNAVMILTFIEALIEQYTLDPDDFVFQCKFCLK